MKSWHTLYDMDEPVKHHNQWEKPDTNDHVFYDSIYMKYLDQVNPQRQKAD